MYNHNLEQSWDSLVIIYDKKKINDTECIEDIERWKL